MDLIADIREASFPNDIEALEGFLDKDDRKFMDKLPSIVSSHDGFCLVADNKGMPFGWAVVHLNYRADYGWDTDADTIRFQTGENSYLENLAVAQSYRRHGIGTRLLQAAESRTVGEGKKAMWLHVREQNTDAVRFYERENWCHRRTSHPAWCNKEPMRVYMKSLDLLRA